MLKILSDVFKRPVLFSLVLAAVLAGVLAGCGVKNPHPTGSYDRAVFFAEQGKNIEAVAALESYVRHNPTDSLASEAQYLKAMTYLDMEEFPLAVVEFQILRKDFPNSPRYEDAMFQEGVGYYNQVGKIQRDVTGAYEARLHFLKFSQEFPASIHVPEVVQYMQEISDLLVRKRLEQAKVFGQLKRPLAQVQVYEDMLENEAGSTYIPEVIMKRAQVALKLDDPDTAARMYERLINEFPDSDLVKSAQRGLKKLDQEDEDEDDQ